MSQIQKPGPGPSKWKTSLLFTFLNAWYTEIQNTKLPHGYRNLDDCKNNLWKSTECCQEPFNICWHMWHITSFATILKCLLLRSCVFHMYGTQGTLDLATNSKCNTYLWVGTVYYLMCTNLTVIIILLIQRNEREPPKLAQINLLES